MEIQDRVVMVTGASSGLGAAVASRVVAKGGRVVVLDINEEAGVEMARSLGVNAKFLRTDVTSEADGIAAVKFAMSEFGALDGLVNCAGIAPGAKVVGRDGPHDLEVFAKTISINLIGTFNMIRLAAEAMSKQKPNDEGDAA